MRIDRLSKIGKDAKSNCMPEGFECKEGVANIHYSFLKENGKYGKGRVVFNHVFAYGFTPGHPPKESDILEAYDNVYIRENSDWFKKQLDQLRAEEIPSIPLPKWKHHILYFDDEGYYEVIANDFEIIE